METNNSVDHFLEALRHTLGIEGPESNHPLDPGGQTVFGISRNNWPHWEGWSFVDSGAMPSTKMIHDFYWINFWSRIRGEDLGARSLELVKEVFDTSVNVSVYKASKILQEGLNLLNKNQLLWFDLITDGRIGEKTIAAVDSCMAYGRLVRLTKLLNHLQAEHYITLMRRYPEKEEFSGWFERT